MEQEVERKVKEKLKRSFAESQSPGIERRTKASKTSNTAAPPLSRSSKADAAKGWEEKEKRTNTGRKVASMPQVSSGSSDEGSDSERPRGKEGELNFR